MGSIPERSAGSLLYGSTKTTVRQSFLYDEEKGLTNRMHKGFSEISFDK